MLVDTHAHLHHAGLAHQIPEILARASAGGVTRILTVGVDEIDSRSAIAVAAEYDRVWAVIGLHPHEADRGPTALDALDTLATAPKVVAIGECGLDYYRNNSMPAAQQSALRYQIELALRHDLPLVFHVREAFMDFFKILDDYPTVRGVVHCFTGTAEEMQAATNRGLYIALNGIMTFTKDPAQLETARAIPLERLLLETDCPFLAPAPLRGATNEPANIAIIAEFLAELRGESVAVLAAASTANACDLFAID